MSDRIGRLLCRMGFHKWAGMTSCECVRAGCEHGAERQKRRAIYPVGVWGCRRCDFTASTPDAAWGHAQGNDGHFVHLVALRVGRGTTGGTDDQ
jgi:hypothetical protein